MSATTQNELDARIANGHQHQLSNGGPAETAGQRASESKSESKSRRTFFTTKIFHLLFCLTIVTQGCAVTGYHSAITTTIQKQFSISTGDYGLITSSYEVACIIMVLVISYFGHRYNRARLVGFGALLVSLGCFIWLVPFFIDLTKLEVLLNDRNFTSLADSTSSQDPMLCRSDATSNSSSDQQQPTTPAYIDASDEFFMSDKVLKIGIFVLGRVFMGVGSAPIYTIGFTYLYDNIPDRSRYPIYSSLAVMCTGIGPALGFFIGRAVSTTFVLPWDPPKGMTPESESFISAWWIGMAFCAIIAMFPGFPLLLFPKQLSAKYRPKELRKASISDASADHTVGPTVTNTSPSSSDHDDANRTGEKSGLLTRVRRLFSNVIWLSITICLTAEISTITGMMAYLPKYLEIVFHVNNGLASLITGLFLIPAGALGIGLSGCILTKLKSTKKIFTYTLLMVIGAGLLQVPLMFMHCGQVAMAGVTIAYPSNGSDTTPAWMPNTASFSIDNTCNSNCSCSKYYTPVCARGGSQKATFFNPCFAGCLSQFNGTEANPKLQYSNCSCVTPSMDQVVIGACEEMCMALVVFLVLLAVLVLLISSAQSATMMLTLQAAQDDDTSFALGVQNVIVRLLANIPAPIYFGLLFDAMCIYHASGNRCLVENVVLTPLVIIGAMDVLKLISATAVAYGCLHVRRFQVYAIDQSNSSNQRTYGATVHPLKYTPRELKEFSS